MSVFLNIGFIFIFYMTSSVEMGNPVNGTRFIYHCFLIKSMLVTTCYFMGKIQSINDYYIFDLMTKYIFIDSYLSLRCMVHVWRSTVHQTTTGPLCVHSSNKNTCTEILAKLLNKGILWADI